MILWPLSKWKAGNAFLFHYAVLSIGNDFAKTLCIMDFVLQTIVFVYTFDLKRRKVVRRSGWRGTALRVRGSFGGVVFPILVPYQKYLL